MRYTKRFLFAGAVAFLVAAAFVFFGLVRGADGVVDVVVNWPGSFVDAHTIQKSDGSGKAWVILDRGEKTVTLVNFPAGWTFKVVPTRESRPSISVACGFGSRAILVRGYSGGEMITESKLDSPGETAELMLLRCSIETAPSDGS
jgi:hypothetical protein